MKKRPRTKYLKIATSTDLQFHIKAREIRYCILLNNHIKNFYQNEAIK